MPVIPESELRKLIGRGDSLPPKDQEAFSSLQALAETDVEKELGWRLAQATRTEFYPRIPEVNQQYKREDVELEGSTVNFLTTSSGLVLALESKPVRSITSIYVDPTGYFGQVAGAFAEDKLLTAGTDYYLAIERSGISETGHVYRRGTAWPSQPGSIKVTYVSGLAAAELSGEFANVKAAIFLTFVDYWNRYQQLKAGQAGKEMNSESIGGGVSASYVTEYCGQHGIPDTAYEKIAKMVSYSELEL